jgi:outer membrane protein assembly factor BamB
MSQKLNISRFLLFVLFWTGCQTIQFERPNIVTDSDWLVDGYTQNRSRSTSDGLALPLEVAWEYNAAAAFGPGSPLILNGVVLIGTNKGEVHSIELATGRKRGFKNFGDGIEAPLAISEGFMYVASAWGKRVLTAFDLKKATFLWKNGGTPIESGFVVTDGLIIAADVQGMVHAFDQKTGEEQWKIELGDRVSVQSSLLLIQNKGVFVVDDAGRASLLNILDGSVLWSRQLSGPVYEGASSIGSSIAVSTTRGTVEVLDSDDGSAKWIYHSTNSSVRFGATAISENLVVVGATDGVVRAFLVENGVEKWFM